MEGGVGWLFLLNVSVSASHVITSSDCGNFSVVYSSDPINQSLPFSPIIYLNRLWTRYPATFSVKSWLCQEPIFTDILNFYFQSNSPTFSHLSSFSHDHSSSKQDKTIHSLTTQVHGDIKCSCCTGLLSGPLFPIASAQRSLWLRCPRLGNW